jgi:ribosomal protein S18 acetylase RimI-like enzyme
MRDDVQIEVAAGLDAEDCRRLVLRNEPWITLGYGEADVDRIVRGSAADSVLLARLGDRVVGFALSAPGVLLGEYLKMLAVDPEQQSRGIGRALMSALEQRAFQRWPNVYLCVSDFNHAARGFYRRLGYEEIGLLHDLLVPGQGEIFMRKTIAAWRAFAVSRSPGR